MYEITTNNHRRELVSFAELPEAALADFDYVEGEDRLSPRFVKYRGDWYDTGDVMIAPDSIRALGWDGFNPDSYWSGMVYRFFEPGTERLLDGGDSVVVGRLLSTED